VSRLKSDIPLSYLNQWSTTLLCTRASFQTSQPSMGCKSSDNNESSVLLHKILL